MSKDKTPIRKVASAPIKAGKVPSKSILKKGGGGADKPERLKPVNGFAATRGIDGAVAHLEQKHGSGSTFRARTSYLTQAAQIDRRWQAWKGGQDIDPTSHIAQLELILVALSHLLQTTHDHPEMDDRVLGTPPDRVQS